ncbi:MAG TPA: sigma-70 family RNA polymerase sigma factor [Blastocatellia bacterium]|nr:sigma-70 family RNA polymerase sigma factor [Blastocatellia bacterium]
MPTATQNITELLTAAQDGDQEAANELFGIVYQELRQMARHYLRQERPNHTLQATALVHEVYLRLFNGQKAEIENRAHFFGIAAAQMRRILVDHARRKQARRRDAVQGQGTFRELPETSTISPEELIALNEALTELIRHYPRAGRVVELRFFGGLTEAETAEVLGISISTLKREWGFAKAWLLRQINSNCQINE